jgi:hypothetical protein
MIRVARPVVLAAALLAPALAAAGFNRTYLVPSYRACPGPATCNPPVLDSSYRFESALLKNSNTRFLVPNKIAFTLELRGVKDAAGNLVTTDPNDPSDDFRIVSSPGRLTLAGQGTFPEGAIPAVIIRFDVTKGVARKKYNTDPSTPPGLVTEGSSVVVLDNQGRRLAVTGAMSRP